MMESVTQRNGELYAASCIQVEARLPSARNKSHPELL